MLGNQLKHEIMCLLKYGISCKKTRNRRLHRYQSTMKYLFLTTTMALMLSCSNNVNDSSDSDPTSLTSAELRPSELTEQEQKRKREQYFIWEVDADKKTITKNPQLQPEFFNVDILIAGLNEMYPEITLEKVRITHDTLYMQIRDAAYLTNQMGSFGAEQYIAQAVINLTSVEGVRYVRIDFPLGSHASPDVWSRESFAGYKEPEDVPEQ